MRMTEYVAPPVIVSASIHANRYREPMCSHTTNQTRIIQGAPSYGLPYEGRWRRVDGNSQAILFVRRTHTIEMCSFDARTRGSTRLPLRMKQEIEMTSAVEDQSAPIPEEITREFGGIK